MIRKEYKGGYLKASRLFNRIFNSSLSLCLLVLVMPLYLFIALLIKLQDRGPVHYKGIRLGLHKKPFGMYKFRTLVPDADKLIGADLLGAQLSSKQHLVTPVGLFLRETRLDELPQLFNILRGEMDFIGPRPERPEIYDRFCRIIKGYDNRFNVNPGLIGYSQLFTPHSTPKRIRSLFDNVFLKKNNVFFGM